MHDPDATMKTIMQVIDGTTVLTPDPDIPNRYTKLAWSSNEQQNVKVVIHRGANFNLYGSYLWVVISAYPFF